MPHLSQSPSPIPAATRCAFPVRTLPINKVVRWLDLLYESEMLLAESNRTYAPTSTATYLCRAAQSWIEPVGTLTDPRPDRDCATTCPAPTALAFTLPRKPVAIL